MTISKEERAELRELVASVTLPLPWKSDSDGVIVSDLYDFVADCDGTGGDFIDPKPAKLIAGAVNALPKTLDALDAADERIAELEAIWKRREKEHELAARMVARKADQLKEANARIAELEAAAQSAIFALQPTWAQDPASSAATLGRAIAAHQESLQALAKGCDYVALGLLAVVETDEDGDTTYKRVRLAPIPALPEGGA